MADQALRKFELSKFVYFDLSLSNAVLLQLRQSFIVKSFMKNARLKFWSFKRWLKALDIDFYIKIGLVIMRIIKRSILISVFFVFYVVKGHF